MGAGSQMSVPPKPLQRATISKPPFTLAEIKKAIPPRCFQRSLLRSFSYLARDLIIVSLLYYIATTYFQLLPRPLSYLAWPLYWTCKGAILTGVWFLAHECGHHAFSDYQWIDDTVGLIIHSSLLVPYFSWKYSHRHHHVNTNSLHYDEAFVPKVKSEIRWFSRYKVLNSPPARVITLLVQLILGIPLYLLFNVSGRDYGRFACHYDPYSPIYSDCERVHVLISDVSVAAVLYGLYRLAVTKGLAWVFCVYGGPLLVVNGFFVVITYLNHTHTSLPHYDSSDWDWLRGSLSTIDRDYGILNTVFHNVVNTHVCHHLVSKIPHYHAIEATEAIKPILGKYYQFDGTPFYKALWREARECIYVEHDEGNNTKGVFWYNNKL